MLVEHGNDYRRRSQEEYTDLHLGERKPCTNPQLSGHQVAVGTTMVPQTNYHRPGALHCFCTSGGLP